MADTPSPPLESAVFAIPDDVLVSKGRRVKFPTPKVARRWITVLEQLERLEQDLDEAGAHVVSQLREHPVGCAELICRWANYDTEPALDAAERVLKGELTVDELRLEEKKARESSVGQIGGRQYGYRLRRSVEKWAPSQFGKGFKALKLKRSDTQLPGDMLFQHEDEENSFASVLIFGPFEDHGLYNSRQNAFLSELVGVAAHTMIERVIGIVPYATEVYWDRLSLYEIGGSSIELFTVHYDKGEFSPLKLERPAGEHERAVADLLSRW